LLTFWGDAEPADFKKVIINKLEELDPVPEWRWVKLSEGPELLVPHKDEVVIAMGGSALLRLKDKGVVKKSASLNQSREQVYAYTVKQDDVPIGLGHWMTTYSPGIINIDIPSALKIGYDIRLARRWLKKKTLAPETGEYVYRTGLKSLLKYCKQKWEETGRPTPVALDLETMGLFPYYPEKQIVTLQATAVAGAAIVVHCFDNRFTDDMLLWMAFMDDVKELLNAPYTVTRGANLKFDLVWIAEKWNIECSNFSMDTLIVGSLLNENRSNSLKWHAKEHTDMGGYEEGMSKYDMGHVEKVPPDVLLEYAGGDADVTLQVSEYQLKELAKRPELRNFYTTLLHPAVRAFEKIERRGVHVDLEAYSALEKEVEHAVWNAAEAALSIVPQRLKLLHGEDIGKPALVREFMFGERGLGLKPKMETEKTKLASTSLEHLEMFEDHPEAAHFVAAYKQWSDARKVLSTYIHGFMAHLRPDNRFHPTFFLFAGDAFGGAKSDGGTVTGRTSAKDPAFQTIPKHTYWAKKLRKGFPAPPGYRMFEVDFSQGELRITACVANETNMLTAYKNGIDLHALTGARLSSTDFEEFMSWKALHDKEADEQHPNYLRYLKYRQQAKAANFGLLYGMGANGYREYARRSYGVIMTANEAIEARENFFDLYPRLKEWHWQYRSFAKNNGYVVSPLGRVRHLPLIGSADNFISSKAERQAINSPIQSTLSDLCLWSIARLEQEYGDKGLWIAGMVHDSMVGYFPEDSEIDFVKVITETMSNLPITEHFGWEPQLKFPVDIAVGDNWANLEEVKMAA
jgi:DNA polymerase I-like protein with 3'-5' exonuclease and polymerase domains